MLFFDSSKDTGNNLASSTVTVSQCSSKLILGSAVCQVSYLDIVYILQRESILLGLTLTQMKYFPEDHT